MLLLPMFNLNLNLNPKSWAGVLAMFYRYPHSSIYSFNFEIRTLFLVAAIFSFKGKGRNRIEP
jgi:hypothetical protein